MIDINRRQVNDKAPKFLPCIPRILSEMNWWFRKRFNIDKAIAMKKLKESMLVNCEKEYLERRNSTPIKQAIVDKATSFGRTLGSRLCQGVTKAVVAISPRKSVLAVKLSIFKDIAEKYHAHNSFLYRSDLLI
jgi:hypothetical protein